MRKMSVLEKHGFAGLNRWPGNEQLAQEDAVLDYFMHGYLPTQSIIDKETNITAFEMCLAFS